MCNKNPFVLLILICRLWFEKNMSNDKLNPVLKNITSWYMRINKKYEENVTVYQILFIKVTYAELNYARTLFVLKYQVPFHLMKSFFCYPILKTMFFHVGARQRPKHYVNIYWQSHRSCFHWLHIVFIYVKLTAI